MPNYEGNPNIAKYGARTRFGQPDGVDPKVARQLATNPWPMRHTVRRIGAARMSITKPVTFTNILRAITPKGQERISDYLAAGLWFSAWQGSSTAWNRLLAITDGPTPTEEEVNQQRLREANGEI